jgi:hypothetical protein
MAGRTDRAHVDPPDNFRVTPAGAQVLIRPSSDPVRPANTATHFVRLPEPGGERVLNRGAGQAEGLKTQFSLPWHRSCPLGLIQTEGSRLRDERTFADGRRAKVLSPKGR